MSKQRSDADLSQRFDAVIFDMDGVIVDSEPLHERAFLEVFAEMGCGDSHGIEFAEYYGKSDRVLWLDFIEKHQPAQSLDQLAEWKQKRFLEIVQEKQPIFESLPELIENLSRRYKLAVASGSSHPVIDAVLAMKNLRRYFGAVVSAQDVERGKPAPDIFLHAAQMIGVRPERCAVLEDSVAGIEAALAAGMCAIGITNSLAREKLWRATHVVSNYGEIETLLG
jgi:HAD superfamily hydrolase (TIGR01509 family)